MLYNEEKEVYHYVWIKNLSRLLSSQLNSNKETNYFCLFCFQHFRTEELLSSHKTYCMLHPISLTELPRKEDQVLRFKNYLHQSKLPFAIYADFECILTKLTNSSKFRRRHIACSFGMQLVSNYLCEEPFLFRGNETGGEDEVLEKFYEKLNEYATRICAVLKTNKPLNMSEGEKKSHNQAKTCYLCNQKFTKLQGQFKVKDHDHFTGMYRGAAHDSCNLKLRNNLYKIPVIFHNMTGYDSHLFVKKIDKLNNIRVTAKGMEKYIKIVGQVNFPSAENCSYTPNVKFQFIDSHQFLHASLEKLVGNLERTDFTHTDKFFKSRSDLFKSKGVYPYDFMDCWKKFDFKELPTKEDFHNYLKGQKCSDQDYATFVKMYQILDCANLGEYHDYYLYSDVTLLADVFEKFRDICIRFYGLDPVYYCTAPSLSFDAMLKMTKVQLNLITDPDIYLLWEQHIRGGLVNVAKRYVKANNKYLPDYNPSKPSSFIEYVDANALYSFVMEEMLPLDGGSYVPCEGFNKETILDLDDYGEDGYLFVVDLHIPKELHDYFNDYPMAPESLVIDDVMLSPKSRELKPNFLNTKVQKLLTTLHDKDDYPVHYRNLKYYLTKGFELKKIHKVLKFKQSAFMKCYIEFNIKQRNRSNINAFEKDFFKLMNNSVFGKTMENVRLYQTVSICRDAKKFRNKIVPNTRFVQAIIIHEDLVFCKMLNKKTLLNKPIFIGGSILDLSKLHMYHFHYEVMKKTYEDKISFFYSDTDSLMYEIHTEDFYEDLLKNKELAKHFDLSSFPTTHPLHNCDNKGKVGRFKVETQDGKSLKLIRESIAIRPKMYHLDVYDTAQPNAKPFKQATKGVPRNTLTHEDFSDCLFKNKTKTIGFNIIASEHHQLYTQKVEKIALCNYDDKRWLCEDGINTRAYGHYKNK